jgi:hypothetical protein
LLRVVSVEKYIQDIKRQWRAFRGRDSAGATSKITTWRVTTWEATLKYPKRILITTTLEGERHPEE